MVSLDGKLEWRKIEWWMCKTGKGLSVNKYCVIVVPRLKQLSYFGIPFLADSSGTNATLRAVNFPLHVSHFPNLSKTILQCIHFILRFWVSIGNNAALNAFPP